MKFRGAIFAEGMSKGVIFLKDENQKRALGNIFKFLALMLVFTLVVRGTSGATMARVTLATPSRSVIADAVNGTATVVATDNIEISAPTGLTVLEIFAGVGREIKIGDTLAIFCEEELSEIFIREEAALKKMQLDLENLQNDDGVDSTALNNAQRSLDRAREDYENNLRTHEENISDAREKLDALLANEFDSSASRGLRRALDDYETAVAAANQNIETAQENLFELLASRENETDDNALLNAIRNHRRVLEDFNATLEKNEEEISEAEEKLRELRSRRPAELDRTAIETAERRLERAQEDYDRARQNSQTALTNAFRAWREAWEEEPRNDAKISAAEAAFDAAQKNWDDGSSSHSRALEDAKINLEQVRKNFDDSQEKEIENAEKNLQTIRERIENSRRNEERKLEDAEINLSNARKNFDDSREKELENAEKALENAQKQATDNLLSASRRLEDATQTAGNETEQAGTALQNAITQANNSRRTSARQVEDAITSLNTAQRNHRNNQRAHENSLAQNNISILTLQLDLTKKIEMIDSLREIISNDGILFSDATGVVLSAVQAGKILSAPTIVTLRDTSGGFEARMNVSRTQAENLSVGDKIEVTTGGGSIFYNPTVTGTISGIALPDENENVQITIALPVGNWTSGQRVDAQVVLSSGNYDLSLPVSAVRSDNDGYFLYVLTQTNTVLGLQNEVVRVNVEINARDTENVAVRGAVSNNTEVIVASNKAISVGDRVRVG